MSRRIFLFCIASVVCIPFTTLGAPTPSASETLGAAEIADKNVTSRGGLQAWRGVESMSYSGKLDAGGKENVQLPFVMEMKRPRKTRFELEFANDKAVQVYDGANGWKLRPFLGRNAVEPYSTDELKWASLEPDLDGPLVDYAAKGIKVELEGIEKVEDRGAYKLKLTLKGDQVRHLWIDAETFLEVKMEGTPRRLDGKMHPVEIYYRDYKSVNGLMIPHILETAVQGVKQTRKVTIETVLVNPKLEDSQFAKPKPSK